MADVDLLIALSGGERVQRQLGDVNRGLMQFRNQTMQGIQSIRGMSDALGALSGQGKFTAESLIKLTSVMPLFATSGPVGLAVAGIGAMALQIWEVEKAGRAVRESGVSAEFTNIGLAFERIRAASSVLQGALFAGEDRDIAEAKQYLETEKQRTEQFIKQRQIWIATAKETGKGLEDVALWEKQIAGGQERIGRLHTELNKKIEARRKLTREVLDDTIEEGAREDALERARQISHKNHMARLKEELRMAEELRRRQGFEGQLEQGGLAVSVISTTRREVDALTQAHSDLASMVTYAVADVAVSAYDQYATAMERVIDGHNAFNASSGRAMQNATANIIKSLGQQAAAQSIMELAAGFSKLSNPATAPMAGANFQAAALYASVALMAGVGGAAMSVKPGGGGGGGGRGAGGPSPSSGMFGGPSVSVTVIGNLDDDQAQSLGRRIRQAMTRGDA